MSQITEGFKALNTYAAILTKPCEGESKIFKERRDPTGLVGLMALKHFTNSEDTYHFSEYNAERQPKDTIHSFVRTINKESMSTDIGRFTEPVHSFVKFYLQDPSYKIYAKKIAEYAANECQVRASNKKYKHVRDCMIYLEKTLKNEIKPIEEFTYPETFKIWSVEEFAELADAFEALSTTFQEDKKQKKIDAIVELMKPKALIIESMLKNVPVQEEYKPKKRISSERISEFNTESSPKNSTIPEGSAKV